MKKKNGFVFIETMIVIVTLLVSLLALYSAYVSLIRSERIRVRYDEPSFIYKTYNVGKFLLSLYDDDGNPILANKIEQSLRYDSTVPYISINVDDADLFSTSYNNENSKRKSFFSQMYNSMNIQNIIIVSTGRNSLKKLKAPYYSDNILPENFRKYLKTIDTDTSNRKYYLVIEYAEKVNGNACSPNQLIGQRESGQVVESSCTFFYSNIELNKEALGW